MHCVTASTAARLQERVKKGGVRERGGREGGQEGGGFLETGVCVADSHPLLKEPIGLLQFLGLLLQPGKHSPALLQQLSRSIREGLAGSVGGGEARGGEGRMVAAGGLGGGQRDFLWLGERPESDESGSLSMAAAVTASALPTFSQQWVGSGA